MKKLLNTLFVTTQGAWLAKDGDCAVVKVEGREALRVPIRGIGAIVCYGVVSVSPYLAAMCAEYGVSVSFLTDRGKFLSRMIGRTTGNVLLRRKQYRDADSPEKCAVVCKYFIVGKLHNCRTVLRRSVRDHPEKIDNGRINLVCEKITRSLSRLKDKADIDEIRGIEGDCGRMYFGVFDEMILAEDDVFRFNGRNRRPPLDPVNCLLSFIYTLLMVDVRSALESVGLDPYVGYLHTDRPGRASLALDMMEEFRPFIADRLVLSMINRGELTRKDFTSSDSGAVSLKDDARKSVLVGYQKRKQEEVIHPFLNEKMPLGIVFHTQALLLARYLRNDLDAYPPFAWR